jgi:AAA+ superfamily predicted ATPase/ATP-dependent Clp protease adapter protein ClpS
MRNVPSEASYVAITLLNDEETPWDFVVALLRSIFGKSEQDAVAAAAATSQHGRTNLGSYPPTVAQALLSAARERIAAAGYPLALAAEPIAGTIEGQQRCGFCGDLKHAGEVSLKGKDALICDQCLVAGAARLSDAVRGRLFKYTHEALSWHFAGIPHDQLLTTARQFPGHMRADVQSVVNKLFPSPLRFFGIYEQHRYETITFASLARDGQQAIAIAPAQFQDVDIGDEMPVNCLVNGLWLCRSGDLPYAVVLSFHREYGVEAGTRIEIAVPIGEAGSAFAQRCFAELEAAINTSRSYRGKILSFEAHADYRGRSKSIIVHRLPKVAAHEVILPEATLKLLDDNVLKFVRSRDSLRSLGQSTRKGILLYGPPGTGKTHTIRYLVTNLPDHTTLIITAEQVALLSQYMNLARLLQPALVVIEDVDLIARAREDIDGPCAESMLNKLLNEMDGLKEDADILFVLTTNRPEQLESALAGRPGRIDQAVETPLPDAAGRDKLIRLYGKGLRLPDTVVSEAAKRTDGVSAAFIKEMMRRTAQASIERDGSRSVTIADLTSALNDMLFSGGKLNVKLLGGAQDVESYPASHV